MGHISNEPSMEEILSSIKRIIAEDGAKPRAPRRADPEAPEQPAIGDAPTPEPEVLELTDMVAGDEAPASTFEQHLEAPPEAAMPPIHSDVPSTPASPPPPAELVSTDAASASREALASLSRLLVKPEPGNDGTLEGLVRELLRPMLKDWLDANLPDLVESMVAKEIARITGKAL